MIPNEFTIKTEHFKFSAYDDEEPNIICSVIPDNWTGCENGLFVVHDQMDLIEKLEALRAELKEIIRDVDYADIYERSCWNILPRNSSKPEEEAETDG